MNTITGRTGHDLIVRKTKKGTPVTNITVYENHRPMSDGTEVPSTRHQVTVWGDLALAVAQFIGKGDYIQVNVKRTEPNTYINDEGTKVVGVTLVASDILFSVANNRKQIMAASNSEPDTAF